MLLICNKYTWINAECIPYVLINACSGSDVTNKIYLSKLCLFSLRTKIALLFTVINLLL